MNVVVTADELRDARKRLKSPFGLVPTMGNLHEGHLSLVRQARDDCASVGVSIFVNPTQFGPDEDLSTYPRDLDRDLEHLEREGVDLVWTPTSDEVYPEGAQTWVTVEMLSLALEGSERPGHFRGVATVVTKLFNAFQPDKAYFGQKDVQQTRIIRQLVRDLMLPIEIVVCPTVREPDGLAMSSRNSYLKPDERKAATVLFRALQAASQAYDTGERVAEVLRDQMRKVLEMEPLAKTQYVSVADPVSFEECQGEIGRALLSMAVYIGESRLIDNVVVGD